MHVSTVEWLLGLVPGDWFWMPRTGPAWTAAPTSPVVQTRCRSTIATQTPSTTGFKGKRNGNIRNLRVGEVEAEIEKCDAVCLLCHADRTFEQRKAGRIDTRTKAARVDVECSEDESLGGAM